MHRARRILALFAGCLLLGGAAAWPKTISATAIVERLPPRVTWRLATRIDLDCDGRVDSLFTARDDSAYYVAAVLAPFTLHSRATYVTFALRGDAEDAFCGEPAPLAVESLDVDIAAIVGEQPEGWRRSKRCKGLQLTAGDCDAFHLFWNRKTKALDWWRL